MSFAEVAVSEAELGPLSGRNAARANRALLSPRSAKCATVISP